MLRGQAAMLAEEALERLRALARKLPEVEESLSFGVHPTFKAGKKTFAVLEHHQHSVPDEHLGRPSLTFKVEPEFQRVLCAGGSYFVAPYVGKHGWGMCCSTRTSSGTRSSRW
jgi:predicted DNA-binding protein (MmcQ/YjbR family)